MTAVVRPTNSLQVLHLLEQCFRRHFQTLRVHDDQILVHVPAVGRVLVTEQLARMRLDFLTDEDEAETAVAALEAEVRSQVRHQELSIRWERSDIIPAALR